MRFCHWAKGNRQQIFTKQLWEIHWPHLHTVGRVKQNRCWRVVRPTCAVKKWEKFWDSVGRRRALPWLRDVDFCGLRIKLSKPSHGKVFAFGGHCIRQGATSGPQAISLWFNELFWMKQQIENTSRYDHRSIRRHTASWQTGWNVRASQNLIELTSFAYVSVTCWLVALKHICSQILWFPAASKHEVHILPART